MPLPCSTAQLQPQALLQQMHEPAGTLQTSGSNRNNCAPAGGVCQCAVPCAQLADRHPAGLPSLVPGTMNCRCTLRSGHCRSKVKHTRSSTNRQDWGGSLALLYVMPRACRASSVSSRECTQKAAKHSSCQEHKLANKQQAGESAPLWKLRLTYLAHRRHVSGRLVGTAEQVQACSGDCVLTMAQVPR